MDVIAVVSGRSGSGKTLFLEKLVENLVGLRCRVPVVKHIHHGGLTLMEGKDTERIFLAGASAAAAYAGDRAMILLRGVTIQEILRMVATLTRSRFILAEGFRGQAVASKYIYVSHGPEDLGCRELGESLLLSTSMQGRVDCPRFFPFEEAVKQAANWIYVQYCQQA